MKILENIIEKLETEQKACETKHVWDYAKGLEYAIGIINQETAEYQDFDMEFAKKCVELSEKMNVCDLVAENCRLSNENRLLKLKAEYNNGWIPVSERLPEEDKYILISFSNFSVPCVGRYEEDENGGAFYVGDDDETCVSQDLFVNAWKPLPAPYQTKGEV